MIDSQVLLEDTGGVAVAGLQKWGDAMPFQRSKGIEAKSSTFKRAKSPVAVGM